MKTTQTVATETTTIHIFERAGLGKAPFRFVGMGQQDRLYGEVMLNRAEYECTGIALTTKPGGTCAFCGRAIKNVYEVKSADGKCFHVGCECVNKTGDAGLRKSVSRAKRELDTAKRTKREVAQATELRALLADVTVREKLNRIPHPKKYRAELGETFLDQADWMLKNAGAAGRALTLRQVKAALK